MYFIFLSTPETVLVMTSSKPMSICNRFHARLINSGRYRAFWRRGVHKFDVWRRNAWCRYI